MLVSYRPLALPAPGAPLWYLAVSRACVEHQTAGPAVFWQPRARWVFDDDEAGRLFLTSSGVAAGGDAALALIARLVGDAEADRVATAAEWTWHRDADEDPFATE